MNDSFQPFKVGDWQSRPERPAKKTETGDSIKFDRAYPLFQRYLEAEDFSPLFQTCQDSCIELDRLVRVGSREQAEAAQQALNAYGLSMQMAKELMDLKAKLRGW